MSHDHHHGESCCGSHDEADKNQHEEQGHAHEESGGCGCSHNESRAESVSLIGSGALVSIVVIDGWMKLLPAPAITGLAIAAMISGGWFVMPKAARAILRLRPDINLLMVIAALGASVIGEWVEAAPVVFLFGVAEWLEGWADRRARRATEALLEIAPKTAQVKRDGTFVEVPAEQVATGETVAVKSGMGIPLDGEVLSGESAVNQAPITGESVPVDKRAGDTVFAGTINGEGSLEIRVTKAAGDTTLARIIRLVKEAQEQRAPTQRFVDTFARYYTPAVTLGALLVFLVPPLFFGGAWTPWLYRACVLLLIACPCALVISTPVSIVAGLTALARRGVLVKGGAHLETIARLKALAMDKTGTITEGKPRVFGVESLGTMSEQDIVGLAAGIDEHSAHPIAKAVVAHAKEIGATPRRAGDYHATGGRGAEGALDGHEYFVGNHRFTHELGVCSEDIERRIGLIEAKGQSVVVVGHKPHGSCAGEALGIIAVGDTVRPHAAEAIRALHAAGVSTIVMLSGDNQRAADHIAGLVGIDRAKGDLLPADKVAAVKSLREEHGVVAMIGDGVNDAPAMAAAGVGIAMGAAGTDAAIETADIALMQDDLTKVAETVTLARRTMGVIRFNIAFALGLKAVFLVLTLTGHATLWLAILADTGATLLVVANALRLLRR
jgi:Cd2+/Zn2+-exporting ATPase